MGAAPRPPPPPPARARGAGARVADPPPERRGRHARTPGVPAGPAGPVGARPGRAARDLPPESEVAHVPAPRVVEREVVLRGQDALHARAAQTRKLAVALRRRDREAHASAPL